MPLRAETDSEQLALLGIAFSILDKLLSNAVMLTWNQQNESKEAKSERIGENIFSILLTNLEITSIGFI